MVSTGRSKFLWERRKVGEVDSRLGGKFVDLQGSDRVLVVAVLSLEGVARERR